MSVLKGDRAFIQVYEDTTSVKAGDLIYTEDFPLYVELGPGLIGNIYDGVQRPLEAIKKGVISEEECMFLPFPERKMAFLMPFKKVGEDVKPGDFLGEVEETTIVKHKILVPPDYEGKIVWIASEGEYTVSEKYPRLNLTYKKDLFLFHKWPVSRPYKERLPILEPLVTGQRVIDTLFPIGRC